MPRALQLILGVLGALIYAGAGAVMGSQNAGWFGLERNANQLMLALGVGGGLVIFAFAPSTFRARLREVGGLGLASQILLVVGCLFFILSPIIQFAIFGTFAFGFGLVCLAITVVRAKLVPVTDRVLIALSAIGSLTWNTETTSAFLLAGVGLIWVVETIRLLNDDSLAAYRSL